MIQTMGFLFTCHVARLARMSSFLFFYKTNFRRADGITSSCHGVDATLGCTPTACHEDVFASGRRSRGVRYTSLLLRMEVVELDRSRATWIRYVDHSNTFSFAHPFPRKSFCCQATKECHGHQKHLFPNYVRLHLLYDQHYINQRGVYCLSLVSTCFFIQHPEIIQNPFDVAFYFVTVIWTFNGYIWMLEQVLCLQTNNVFYAACGATSQFALETVLTNYPGIACETL